MNVQHLRPVRTSGIWDDRFDHQQSCLRWGSLPNRLENGNGLGIVPVVNDLHEHIRVTTRQGITEEVSSLQGESLRRDAGGRIDDLRIYNCALSAAELADLCSISTSASAQAPKSTVTTFPNPTTGLVTISGLSPEAVGSPWHLVDALGRKLPMQTTIAGGSLQLDLTKYPAGLYVIQSGAHRIPVLRD